MLTTLIQKITHQQNNTPKPEPTIELTLDQAETIRYALIYLLERTDSDAKTVSQVGVDAFGVILHELVVAGLKNNTEDSIVPIVIPEIQYQDK